jgi:hypothetical protein
VEASIIAASHDELVDKALANLPEELRGVALDAEALKPFRTRDWQPLSGSARLETPDTLTLTVRMTLRPQGELRQLTREVVRTAKADRAKERTCPHCSRGLKRPRSCRIRERYAGQFPADYVCDCIERHHTTTNGGRAWHGANCSQGLGYPKLKELAALIRRWAFALPDCKGGDKCQCAGSVKVEHQQAPAVKGKPQLDTSYSHWHGAQDKRAVFRLGTLTLRCLNGRQHGYALAEKFEKGRVNWGAPLRPGKGSLARPKDWRELLAKVGSDKRDPVWIEELPE